jgi:hypothetical protein
MDPTIFRLIKNKYLKLEEEITLITDLDKYNHDTREDGFKGYLANTMLTEEEIIKK